MSTFKRLLNIGKGKAKVASRGMSDALDGARSGTGDGQWTADARHRAADVAEALADVIRPEDQRIDAAAPRQPDASPSVSSPERTVKSSASNPTRSDPAPTDPAPIGPASSAAGPPKPKKRRL
ncbi:MAG: hypothetical protein GWP91_13115 [Rhodobacterales bacterium]|nr:hypothetical protein [Rhodobacterales bacterium]